jgi:hypothetical protein
VGNRSEVVGAWLLLVGTNITLFGFAWDAQWHLDVGPDTFFTAPHTMLYSGTALVGLTCLVVVLLESWRARGLESARHVRVFGIFRAPVAFLVGGLGAAGFLLYGLGDLWWHTIYGFDVATTPPHIGIVLSTAVQAVAVVLAFGPLHDVRSARWGFAAACGLGLANIISLQDITSDTAPMLAGLGALTLGLAAGVTRSARWMVAAGLAYLAVQAVAFWFAPLATEWYADTLGLPYRDYAPGMPAMALALPAVLPIAAMLAAGVVVLAQRWSVRPSATMLTVGGLIGAGVAGWYLLVGEPSPAQATTFAVAVGAGAGLGWFGWQCAALLRQRTPKAVS